jgi:hypothetical protein
MGSLKNFILAIILIFTFGCNRVPTEQVLYSNDFKNPPQSVKLHAYWQWMDDAITKDGITKDLESMKQQGIVQTTIMNGRLFGQKDFGVPQVKFYTPEWFEMFRWALQEANRLGIILGAHNCDGWSLSGGPWITPEMSMKQYVWTKTALNGGKEGSVKLAKPYNEKDFYQDVAVVAYKSEFAQNSFQAAHPKVLLNDTIDGTFLFDGNPVSAVRMRKGDKIMISFPTEFTAEKIVIHPRCKFIGAGNDTSRFSIFASNDGKNFQKVNDIEVVGVNNSIITSIKETNAKYFKIELLNIPPNRYILNNGYTVSEVELLKNSEFPSYSVSIPHHLEKTGSLIAESKTFFEVSDPSGNKGRNIPENSIIDLTAKMAPDGTLRWNAPEGNWFIIRFGFTTTSAINGPASKEGTGLECDKMDTCAVNLHFKSFPELLAENAGKFNGNTFKFIHIDSWERGFQNWTQNFPAEFERRRGYNIINWIPVLCGETIGNAQLSEGFLFDFRKTISDLIEQNYYKHFSELCHRHKLEFHSEVNYGDGSGPPLDILKSNGYIDLPMYEFWAVGKFYFSDIYPKYTPVAKPDIHFAAYSSVLYNKPVIGAEAYTGMAHYSESPYDLKLYGDKAYCSGVNQFILHGYVHQPFDKQPGMTLGRHGSHFNRNNPWWQFASGWINYQSRIQFVLQKGETVSDILYYIGDEPSQFLENKTVNELPFGYRPNICNYDILKNKASVKNGRITFADSQNYRILVLPDNNSGMELSTLRRISELVFDGAVVYGTKPDHMFSLKGIKKDKLDFKKLVDILWGKTDDNSITENPYGKGKVIWKLPIGQVLARLNVAPDFKTGRADSLKLMFIHKKLKNTDVFFVINQQDDSLSRECIFRTGGKTPEIWDPENGTIIKPAIYSVENSQIRIPVTFRPRQSMFFVFTDVKPGNYIRKVTVDGKQIFPLQQLSDTGSQIPMVRYSSKGFDFYTGMKGEYVFTTDNDKEIITRLNHREVIEIRDFKGEVEFSPIYKAILKPVEISELQSYTGFADPAIKYFTGTAKYKIRFSLPPSGYLSKNDSVLLSIGKIDATGEVRFNNHLLGNVWLPDFMFNVTNLLKSENLLEIVVANTCRNRIIGDFIEYGKLQSIWTSAPVGDFLDKEKPLKHSGVMGPLRLIKYSRQTVLNKPENNI